MASAWAQLSKDDQAAWSATGMTKSKYNEQYGKGGATAPPPPKAPTPSPTPVPSPAPTPAPTPTASPEPSYSSSMMASSRNEPVTGPTFEPASSNEEPSRSTAVDKTKTWADLSKDERATTGMTKKEYNRQDHGLHSALVDPVLEATSNMQLQEDPTGISEIGPYQSWADMSKTERKATGMTKKEYNRQTDNTSYANPDYLAENQAQEEFREIRNEAYAGTEKGSGERKGWEDRLDADTSAQVNTLQDTIYGKDNIEDYNFAMGGTGSLKGKEAISKADLKGLQGAGFSDQEIIDHVNREMQGEAYIKGPKAQRFLDKMIAGLQSETPVVDPLPEIDDTALIETPGVNTGGTGGSVDTGDTGSNNDSTNTIEIGGGNPVVGGGGQNPGGSNNGSVDNSFNETINQVQDVDITQGNNQTFNVEQNNDLNSVITGDNNISNIEQNNSVSNIGGEQSNTANVTGASANTSASGFLNNYLSQLPVLQNFYAAGGSLEGGSNSSSTTSSPIPASTYTSPSSYSSPYTNTQNSYNDLINQTQDVDVAETNDQNFSVTQDNDLNSQIIGDNNVSNITQDNSVRNYGGDQRNFTYVSGSSANGTPTYLTDSPVSAATMAGYYAPNDSPASNAAFVDRYQTMNADAQKKYDPFGTAEGYIARGKNVGNMDMSVVNQMNLLRPELAYARSDMANLNTYGDRYSAPGLRWNSALGIYEPIDAYDPEAIAEQAQNMFK